MKNKLNKKQHLVLNVSAYSDNVTDLKAFLSLYLHNRVSAQDPPLDSGLILITGHCSKVPHSVLCTDCLTSPRLS